MKTKIIQHTSVINYPFSENFHSPIDYLWFKVLFIEHFDTVLITDRLYYIQRQIKKKYIYIYIYNSIVYTYIYIQQYSIVQYIYIQQHSIVYIYIYVYIYTYMLFIFNIREINLISKMIEESTKQFNNAFYFCIIILIVISQDVSFTVYIAHVRRFVMSLARLFLLYFIKSCEIQKIVLCRNY